jgi:hypothetical protein
MEGLVCFHEGVIREQKYIHIKVTPLMMLAVFWDVGQGFLAEIYRLLELLTAFIIRAHQHPRKQSSSYLSP